MCASSARSSSYLHKNFQSKIVNYGKNILEALHGDEGKRGVPGEEAEEAHNPLKLNEDFVPLIYQVQRARSFIILSLIYDVVVSTFILAERNHNLLLPLEGLSRIGLVRLGQGRRSIELGFFRICRGD